MACWLTSKRQASWAKSCRPSPQDCLTQALGINKQAAK